MSCAGVDALLGFAIEGDAGGDDPQVQELFLYQTGGGLPSKVRKTLLPT
jgi:endothelin-converting enzyme